VARGWQWRNENENAAVLWLVKPKAVIALVLVSVPGKFRGQFSRAAHITGFSTISVELDSRSPSPRPLTFVMANSALLIMFSIALPSPPSLINGKRTFTH